MFQYPQTKICTRGENVSIPQEQNMSRRGWNVSILPYCILLYYYCYYYHSSYHYYYLLIIIIIWLSPKGRWINATPQAKRWFNPDSQVVLQCILPDWVRVHRNTVEWCEQHEDDIKKTSEIHSALPTQIFA